MSVRIAVKICFLQSVKSLCFRSVSWLSVFAVKFVVEFWQAPWIVLSMQIFGILLTLSSFCRKGKKIEGVFWVLQKLMLDWLAAWDLLRKSVVGTLQFYPAYLFLKTSVNVLSLLSANNTLSFFLMSRCCLSCFFLCYSIFPFDLKEFSF
jgi:hypothetical protein